MNIQLQSKQEMLPGALINGHWCAGSAGLFVNETTNYWDQLAPFGGAGRSGVRRELSQWFLDAFTEAKLISFDLGGERGSRRVAGG